MADKGLDNLFYDTLRDIYYAERHILKNLPQLEKAAVSDELKRRLRTGTIVTTDDRNWELRYSQSALEIAKFLETRPEVASVYYPGLEWLARLDAGAA